MPGFLPDVQLGLFDANSTLISEDNGWGDSPAMAALFAAVGAFALAPNSLDSAFAQSLPPGAYTAEVSGTGGTTGVALAEVYDADTGSPAARFTNASARTFVGTGADVLIAGFVITGNGNEKLLVRGIGPGLSQFGVQGILATPSLTIFDSSRNPLYSATAWGGTSALKGAFSAVGAFPLQDGSADCALLVSLPAGAYTAEVSGVGGTTGIALVEVYEVQ